MSVASNERNIVLHGCLNTITATMENVKKSFFHRPKAAKWKQRYWRLVLSGNDNVLLFQKSRAKRSKVYKTIELDTLTTEISNSWSSGTETPKYGYAIKYQYNGKTYRMDVAVSSRIARKRWISTLKRVFEYKESSEVASSDLSDNGSVHCIADGMNYMRSIATSDLSLCSSANHILRSSSARTIPLRKSGNKCKSITRSMSSSNVNSDQLCADIAQAAANERILRQSVSLPLLSAFNNNPNSNSNSNNNSNHSHSRHHLHHHSHSVHHHHPSKHRLHHLRGHYSCGSLRSVDSVASLGALSEDTTIFEGSLLAEHEFEDEQHQLHPKLVLFEEKVDEEDKERPILHTCKLSPYTTTADQQAIGHAHLRLGGRSEGCPITPFEDASNGTENMADNAFENVKLVCVDDTNDVDDVDAASVLHSNNIMHANMAGAPKTAIINPFDMHVANHEDFSLCRNASFRSISSCATIWSILNDNEFSSHCRETIHPIPIFVPSA